MKSAFLLFGSLLALFFASQMSHGEGQQRLVWHATTTTFESMGPPPLPMQPQSAEVWRP